MLSIAHCNAAQELLPATDKCIVTSEPLLSGLSNNVIKYTTSLGNSYVFREPKKLGDKDRFNKIFSVAQTAAELLVAPHIYNVNQAHQQMLMRYIPNIAWPSYEENEKAYGAVMLTLKRFHDGMRADVLKNNPTRYQPFSAILDKKEYWVTNSHMPDQLKTAFDRMQKMYGKALPWLKTQATICHGDLKKKNVLLEQQKDQLYAWLIDFDYAGVGHPYFDVVKFSQKLPSHQRVKLFEVYLEHQPTAEETAQFIIADNALRMLIALIRFDLALKAQETADPSILLSKKEMEDLLNSSEALPSQATILLSDPDPKKQQLAALYALDDFLRNS